MGNVKLLGVIGLYLGPAVVLALFLALLASVATGIIFARRHGIAAARKTALPFGPYLAWPSAGSWQPSLATRSCTQTYMSSRGA